MSYHVLLMQTVGVLILLGDNSQKTIPTPRITNSHGSNHLRKIGAFGKNSGIGTACQTAPCLELWESGHTAHTGVGNGTSTRRQMCSYRYGDHRSGSTAHARGQSHHTPHVILSTMLGLVTGFRTIWLGFCPQLFG